ncbi:hypothetical protein [Halopseudomonas pelagia]|jgi:hypothetical protein|uniref:hypothetical protein n=1 Tax=Halopseudomonas pelagia TaxID=553151 RepID=UPI0030D94585|tara:strand:+ start:4422 stop:4787 length:366 start_codon:yes stop_codon:yes gene_type:complete
MNVDPVLKLVCFKAASPLTKKRIIGRLKNLCNAISDNFPEVQHTNQIKLKHLQYLRNVWFARYSPATVADYERSLRILTEALGKEEHWLPPLKLVKDPAKGGRSIVIGSIRSNARRKRVGW